MFQLDHAHCRERLQTLPQRWYGDPQLLSEHGVRGRTISRPETKLGYLFLDGRGNLIGQSVALERHCAPLLI